MVGMNRLTIIIFFLSISAVWAGAVTRNVPQITIKVLSSHTESTPLSSDDNGVPKNCGTMDYDAYCHHSRNAIVRHFMTVEASNGKSYTLACTVDSIWSKCASLPEGAVFSAQEIKRGITVWYPNAKGKVVKQTYVLVPAGSESAKAQSPQPASSISTQADDAANATQAEAANTTPAGSVPNDRVKCNFASTPSGAEILLDGKYFGNTPSVIVVTAGTHNVVLSMPGFAEWKRELTVTAGSDVDVNAALQKR